MLTSDAEESIPLDEIPEEYYPNLPQGDQKRTFISSYEQRNYHDEDEEPLSESDEKTKKQHVVKHSFAGLNLKSRSISSDLEHGQFEEEERKSVSIEDQQLDQDKKRVKKIEHSSDHALMERSDTIKRLVNHADDESEKVKTENGKKPTIQIPPPLYKFKFKTKKRIISDGTRRYDPGVSLIISRDCIERRSDVDVKDNHFLVGSAAWNYFQKKSDQPFYKDSTSLVIQRDCVDQRIVNIKTPDQHALAISASDMEAFRAFNSLNNELEAETFFDVEDEYLDPGADMLASLDSEADDIIYEKTRAEVYQKSLDQLNNKDGILFDYLAGKISIDSSDKFEIEKWVRAQQSQPTEMYRAYADAVMQSKTNRIEDIQAIVRSKLKPDDIPSLRVKEIFNKIKENSENSTLQQHHLLSILKRQDYLGEYGEEDNSGIYYSSAYSKHRTWRSTVESPKIEVRQIDTSRQQHIIPFQTHSKTWNLPNAPLISVRTSTDYRKKHTLSLMSKASAWRDSLSASPMEDESKKDK